MQLFKEILQVLINQKTILYPTDTVWGIGCDATSEEAVKKVYAIKKRSESKSLVVLVSSLHMLKNYVKVSKKVKKILQNIKQPTTIIYNNPKNIAQNIMATDNTVAIRIVQDNFSRKLIKRFGKPIVSTSANISGEPTPKSFSEIESAILKGVDYVVDLHQERINHKPSTILQIVGDNVITIRE